MDTSPILFFLPAHDEAPTVAAVLARVPTEVAGHPVVTMVVDDGSTDGTAAVAEAAGAHVVRFAANRGLGAAVRAGLAVGAALGAVAVAFCDADGEYDPAELPALAAPVLTGTADYVVGSRFAGAPRRMRPHRWLGNHLLTLALRGLGHSQVTDGQSGYRCLSGEAAARAEVIHDFNYAQVLTLDLASKGFRYQEVPISYRFRTVGRSFVRVVPYLRAVMPAVWRELRSGASAASILHDERAEPTPGRVPAGLIERAVGGERGGRRPPHRHGVMGVVRHEQALAAEREQPLLVGGPELQR